MCTWLGVIFSFLGSYGDRSYLTIWDMMPIFSGVSIGITVFETFKMIETGLILSSGFMSFQNYIYLNESKMVAAVPTCNKTKFSFEPAVGVPYGLSKVFTDQGNAQYANILNWTLDNDRVDCAIWVYLCVALVRLFQFKRYRYYPLRANIVMLLVVLCFTILMNSMIHPNPVGELLHFHTNQFTSIRPYLQVIVFSVSEYLPMHWVTLGYLCPKQAILSQIWTIAAYKIATAFFLLYWIPYVAGDLQVFAKVNDPACLQFFGIHFLFVMIPITLRRSAMVVGSTFYLLYFYLIMMHGITNILLTVDLFEFSFMTSQRILYRYRNLIYVVLIIILFFFTYPFCTVSTHYFLFYLNAKAHFHTIMTFLTLSTFALAIYGLERLNGDYLFMKGTLYPQTNALKILFLINFALVLLFINQLNHHDYRTEHDNQIYWGAVGLCLGPLVIGFWTSWAGKGKYRGGFQPKNRWGMPSALWRNQRRRKTLHTMYAYRMKRDCQHNCLIENPILKMKVKQSLNDQEAILGIKKIFKLKLAMDKTSEDSFIISENDSRLMRD